MSDQIGSPTSARLISDTTVLCLQQAIKEGHTGFFSSDLYHLTNSWRTSWFDFSEEIIAQANSWLGMELALKELKAIPTSEYPTPAVRSMNSQLALTKLENIFTVRMQDWKGSLSLCIDEIL